MALSVGSDPPDPYADLRIAHMGFRRRQYERRRVKSEDLRDGDQYQSLLHSPHQPRCQAISEPAGEPQVSLDQPSRIPVREPYESVASPNLRARGLNIQFGLPPVTSKDPNESPRLEGSEWEAIEERTNLMAQLHTLQAEIIHLARRGNERVGITTPKGDSLPAETQSYSDTRASGRDTESFASTSFSSNDTLIDEDADWIDASGTDPFHDGSGRLVMKVSDLQRLREFRESPIKQYEDPSIKGAFQQILKGFATLGRALVSSTSLHKYAVSAVIVALVALAAILVHL